MRKAKRATSLPTSSITSRNVTNSPALSTSSLSCRLYRALQAALLNMRENLSRKRAPDGGLHTGYVSWWSDPYVYQAFKTAPVFVKMVGYVRGQIRIRTVGLYQTCPYHSKLRGTEPCRPVLLEDITLFFISSSALSIEPDFLRLFWLYHTSNLTPKSFRSFLISSSIHSSPKLLNVFTSSSSAYFRRIYL